MNGSFSDFKLVNTNKPRETYAYDGDDIVIKTPTALLPKETWMKKQIYAKDISSELRNIKNPNYFIPRTLFILKNECFSIEDKVRGQPLYPDYFETLSKDDKTIIYNAIAHFCNDMNQMKPVLIYSDLTNNFNNLLNARQLFSSKEFNTIKQAQTWLKNNSHMGTNLVFSQGDMNSDNIFYYKKEKIVSFIDFADAKYQSASEMFNKDLAKLDWIDINRLIQIYKNLPRKQPVTINGDEYVVKIYSCLKSISCDIQTSLSEDIKFKSALVKTLKNSVEELSIYLKKVKTNSLLDSGNKIKNKLNPFLKSKHQNTL